MATTKIRLMATPIVSFSRRAGSTPRVSGNSIAFIDENGGGPGLRLRKRHQKKSQAAGKARARVLVAELAGLTLGGNSPPDRDCSGRQIKKAKRPRREIDGHYAGNYKTNPI
jgi:hypothetical protein